MTDHTEDAGAGQPAESPEPAAPAHPADAATADTPVDAQPAPEPQPAAPKLPKKLIFKTPMVALVGVAFFALCESTVALTSYWAALLYLIPVAAVIWIVRTRTVIDSEQVVIRRVLGKRVINWSDIAYLRVREYKWIAARLTNGKEVPLPAVRTMHVPVLSLITKGRVGDPTAPVASVAESEPESAPEPEKESEPVESRV